MSGYVIRHHDGRYVGCPGFEHSYTKHLQDARVWRRAEGARPELCVESESVIAVDDLILTLAEPPSARVVPSPR